MDDKRTDVRAALRELAAEEPGAAGPHCGLERLIAYRRGALPAAEREAVQEHLSLCPRCTGLLREMRDFEAAAARGDAMPEPQRQGAWEALAGRLAAERPAVPPASGAGAAGLRTAAGGRRLPRWAAAAALLLALLGLALWGPALPRERPGKDGPALAPLQVSLAEAERRRGTPGGATGRVDVALSPRFELRGQESRGALRSGGVVNHVQRSAPEGRATVAFDLGAIPAHPEYRLGLVGPAGEVLWVGRRPARSLLGDAGTSVALSGLAPGLYRLRIEGLRPGGSDLLAEYLLDVPP